MFVAIGFFYDIDPCGAQNMTFDLSQVGQTIIFITVFKQSPGNQDNWKCRSNSANRLSQKTEDFNIPTGCFVNSLEKKLNILLLSIHFDWFIHTTKSSWILTNNNDTVQVDWSKRLKKDNIQNNQKGVRVNRAVAVGNVKNYTALRQSFLSCV